MPLSADEAKVGTTAYFPDDGIMVRIVDLSENGQVVVRPVDADLDTKDRPDFTVDPEELDVPTRAGVNQPTVTRAAGLHQPPPVGVASPSTAIKHDWNPGVELTHGMAQQLAGLITANPGGTLRLNSDSIAGATMVVAEITTEGQHDGRIVRRWLVGDAGLLELGVVS